MRNTDFMNLSLPEGADKIDVEILNSDFTAIENLLKQHAIIETMTLNGEGVIIGAIGPYIRLQNIDTAQISIDIGKETFTLASGENVIIRETAENIGIITSGNVHITYFVNPKTYADKEFYTKEKVDELLSNVEATIEVDAELSEESENPVQNKAITEQFSHYYTTTETDEKITEKVAEIVAGAPEDFDTLKEMSDWLNQHEDSAATMNSAIQKNTTDIATANTNITKNTTDIATANTAIQKNKTDIETANLVIQQNKTDISTANTNIQKNVDDITATKNDVAINKSTLGMQTKNLLPYKIVPTVQSGITVTVDEDDTIRFTGTTTGSFTRQINFKKPLIFDHDVLITGASKLSNLTYIARLMHTNGETTYTQIGLSGLKVTAGTQIVYIYFQMTITGVTIDAACQPIIVHSDVTDFSYEPYKPNLQEQINSLLARIEVLEGATTTEGGE